MTNTSLARLEADDRGKQAEIRQDPELSWERKERLVKALGNEYHAWLKELEREAGAA